MQSLFEYYGLGKLITLRYGAIPIVRVTGGLKDTISHYNKYNEIGNRFSFKNLNSKELLIIIGYTLEISKDKGKYEFIVSQGMSSNSSWERFGNEYTNRIR